MNQRAKKRQTRVQSYRESGITGIGFDGRALAALQASAVGP
jgi:hypothetical protein